MIVSNKSEVWNYMYVRIYWSGFDCELKMLPNTVYDLNFQVLNFRGSLLQKIPLNKFRGFAIIILRCAPHVSKIWLNKFCGWLKIREN